MEIKTKKIVVGVCAMNRKTMRKPMISILESIKKNYGIYLDIIHFNDSTILFRQIEEWPVVDALITFYSTGYPIEKVMKYIEKYQPYLINDLEKQLKIMNRDCVLSVLNSVGINHPEYGIVRRNDNGDLLNNFEEYEDHIVIDGKIFLKPFVEKPISGEDHNINIYYHSSQGSGCRMLFRKRNNMSSLFSTSSNVRRDKSYIYEKFIVTSDIDVKCYAVGEEYCYAESRKAPAVDGMIDRDHNGKEKREEVVLTDDEMEMAAKIVKVFKHTVCGFDILRDTEKSYVCDVNGFSFVKNVPKYYETAGKIIGEKIFKHFISINTKDNNKECYESNENFILLDDWQSKPLDKNKLINQQMEENCHDSVKEEFSRNQRTYNDIMELAKIKVLKSQF
uniref:Inositol hexakisphosphate and diphosphoinositol-pentakisphosphate kinase n=1 Tax=Strongyloides papillosus TaxID=174720 RepID=A0A0N5CGY8_STREA